MKYFRNVEGEAEKDLIGNDIFKEVGIQNLLIEFEEK
jgi:hypothetical protein